jgi:hypothetical protein
MKFRRSIGTGGIHAIESDQVKVDIQQEHTKIPIVPLLGFITVFTRMLGRKWKSSTTQFVAVSG